LEAFSGGVIAIIITIMVPEMMVPHGRPVDVGDSGTARQGRIGRHTANRGWSIKSTGRVTKGRAILS